MEKVDEILAEAVGKANAAEDAVEKAVTISEMIAVGGDDLGEVLWTIATEPCSSWESIGLGMLEQAVQEAQTATCEARNFLNATQAAAKGYKSKKVKAKAIQELGQLQQQVQKAQQKLVPLNVWQEFVQRTAAHKMMQEVLQKLSPAEEEVDRVEETMQMLISEEGVSKKLMVEAQQAVAKAGEHVNTAVRCIASKKKHATGLAKEGLQKMEERARHLRYMQTFQKEILEALVNEEDGRQEKGGANIIVAKQLHEKGRGSHLTHFLFATTTTLNQARFRA